MTRYLAIYLGTALAVVTALTAFNVVIDPYRLFATGPWRGINAVKPHAAEKQEPGKALLAERSDFKLLILGNSRAEVGFDPESPTWSSKPVLNLALAGTRLEVARNFLKHASSFRKPERVVLGVDFPDFLIFPHESSNPSDTFSLPAHYLLSVRPDGSPNPEYQYRIGAEQVSNSVSLQTFFNAFDTLLAQASPYSKDLTERGFNPLREYVKITADEGYYNVFKQKTIESARTLAKRQRALFPEGRHTSRAFETFRDILAYTEAHGIPLVVLIYPYHADYLQLLDMMGLTPLYEQWLRELVQITAEFPGGHAALWDFSGYNAYTTESVPPRNDRKTPVRWYWEAGHFKKELGEEMLRRLFQGEGGAEHTEGGFGVRLDATNLESHLERLRMDRREYARNHPEAAERVNRWLSGGP